MTINEIDFYFPQTFAITDFIQEYVALGTNRTHPNLPQQITADLAQLLVNPPAAPLPEDTQNEVLDRLNTNLVRMQIIYHREQERLGLISNPTTIEFKFLTRFTEAATTELSAYHAITTLNIAGKSNTRQTMNLRAVRADLLRIYNSPDVDQNDMRIVGPIIEHDMRLVQELLSRHGSENNRLQSFSDMSRLPQIQHLNLSNNELATVPDLNACTNLKTFDARGNPLTAFPLLPTTLTHLTTDNIPAIFPAATPAFLQRDVSPPAKMSVPDLPTSIAANAFGGIVITRQNYSAFYNHYHPQQLPTQAQALGSMDFSP